MMTSDVKGSYSFRSILIGFILFILLTLFVISFLGLDNEFTTVHSSQPQTNNGAHLKTEYPAEDVSQTHQNKTASPKNSFGRRRKGKNYLLIYNNVPKTGSRTLANAIQNSLETHRPRTEMEIMPKIYRSNNQEVTKHLMELKAPYFVHGHFPFIRLNRSNVLYINVVRDPVDQFVSAFYFAHNGDGSRIGSRKKDDLLNNITIDEHLQSRFDLHKDIWRPGLSHFFLSDPSEDEEHNVQIAKKNIEKYFSLVGISEEMDQVTILLQKLFPDLLPGLNNIYRNKNAKMKKATSTNGKVPPSSETVAILKNKLRHDYDLYEYIKQSFYDLRNQF